MPSGASAAPPATGGQEQQEQQGAGTGTGAGARPPPPHRGTPFDDPNNPFVRQVDYLDKKRSSALIL